MRPEAGYERDVPPSAAPSPDGVDVLGRVTIVVPGAVLREGEVYIDLDDLATGPFRVYGHLAPVPGDRFVAERETDPAVWARLIELAR